VYLFISDGRLASASKGKTIKIWSFPSAAAAQALRAAHDQRVKQYQTALAEFEYSASLALAQRTRERRDRLQARAKAHPHLSWADIEAADDREQRRAAGEEHDSDLSDEEKDHRAEVAADPNEPEEQKAARRERQRLAALKATDLKEYLMGRKEALVADNIKQSFVKAGAASSSGSAAAGSGSASAGAGSSSAVKLPHPDKPAPKAPAPFEAHIDATTQCAAVCDQEIDAHTGSIYALMLHPGMKAAVCRAMLCSPLHSSLCSSLRTALQCSITNCVVQTVVW
jgi:hypothetical protein